MEPKRSQGIGGSEAAAVMGLDPWKTPVDVYLEKIGERQDRIDSEAMYWGRTLEDVVAKEYQRRTGHKVQRKRQRLADKDTPILLASLDRVIVGQDSPGVLEVKTANQYAAHKFGDEGTDAVPENYLIQVQQYLMVTGYTWARLAALVGGQNFKVYNIDPDPELHQIIRDECVHFWQNHVVPRNPPDPTTADDILALYPQDSGKNVVADDEILEAVDRIHQIQEQIKPLEQELAELKDRTRLHIEKHQGLLDHSGNIIATYKSQIQRRLDQKRLKEEQPEIADKYTTPNTIRVLRFKKRK